MSKMTRKMAGNVLFLLLLLNPCLNPAGTGNGDFLFKNRIWSRIEGKLPHGQR